MSSKKVKARKDGGCSTFKVRLIGKMRKGEKLVEKIEMVGY